MDMGLGYILDLNMDAIITSYWIIFSFKNKACVAYWWRNICKDFRFDLKP